MCSVTCVTDIHKQSDESNKHLSHIDEKTKKTMVVPQRRDSCEPSQKAEMDQKADMDFNSNTKVDMDDHVDFETDSNDICRMFYNVNDVPASHLVFLFGLQVGLMYILYLTRRRINVGST